MNQSDNPAVNELQADPLLRALQAGWTTQEDKAYVVSIIAWTHTALIAKPSDKMLISDGENCSYYDVTRQAKYNEESLKKITTALGVTELRGTAVPSFARYFVNAVQSLHLMDRSPSVAVLIRLSTHIFSQVIQAIETAIAKALRGTEG